MSTNPFRRSSLKGHKGSSGDGEDSSIASTPIDIPHANAGTNTPLTVNTKGPSTTQKHVNFASPPAIPISPVSYPPSPESTRISPAYSSIQPVLPSPADYSIAIQNDPFQAEAATDEGDGAIEQALENAKVNTVLATPKLETSRQDAVKNTLSKFASAPKRPVASTAEDEALQASASQRQTMDVDAFTRLLLTGDSGKTLRQDESASTVPASAVLTSDTSSGADTASISQRSLFDQGLNADETPRSSIEFERPDHEDEQRSGPPAHSIEGRKKPPPPAPRHGKPIKNEIPSDAPPDQGPSPMITPANAHKKPPTPPLARRRSQNSSTFRPTSSRTSSSSDVDPITPLDDTSHRPPPPPPKSRRPNAATERRPSSELPTTMEESDSAESPTITGRKSSEPRLAPLPTTRNSGKRLSMTTLNPPPVPPPRRGRGSSRSSIDGQGPAITGSNSDTDIITGASFHSDHDTGAAFSSSNANDILADIAALQREVDEARGKVSR